MDASSNFKDSLPTTPEALMAVLDQLGISYSTHHHPPLRTVEESKLHRQDMTGTHIKNLYLRDRKKRNYLLVTQEDQAIDLKSLHGDLASDRLSFGSADRLFEMLGVRPGAVSPFTLINDMDHNVQLALDASLLQADMLYFHPLVNDMTLGVTPGALERFFAYTGHQARLIDFG